jgi:hypothetical protein
MSSIQAIIQDFKAVVEAQKSVDKLTHAHLDHSVMELRKMNEAHEKVIHKIISDLQNIYRSRDERGIEQLIKKLMAYSSGLYKHNAARNASRAQVDNDVKQNMAWGGPKKKPVDGEDYDLDEDEDEDVTSSEEEQEESSEDESSEGEMEHGGRGDEKQTEAEPEEEDWASD